MACAPAFAPCNPIVLIRERSYRYGHTSRNEGGRAFQIMSAFDDEAHDYARQAKAATARRAYAADLRDWAGWCEQHRGLSLAG
jgi:hypothetical protein